MEEILDISKDSKQNHCSMKYIKRFDELSASKLNENESQLNAELLTAAEDGEYDDVVSCVEQGADINTVDESGISPLVYAVFEEHYDIAYYLIEKGADVNATDDKGRTPLMMAATNGDGIEMMKILLEKGAEINATDDLNRTALMMAAIRGKEHNVEFLLQYKPDLHIKDTEHRDALKLARNHGHVDAFKVLTKAIEG